MRIAQIAPLIERVPPETYGGTERVVAYLTDALIALGHEVTLFASGDSKTRATLVPVRPKAMRLDPSCGDWLADHLVLIDRWPAWRRCSTSSTSTPGFCSFR
jgi:hypothetical protein